jgi:hypothetical protein
MPIFLHGTLILTFGYAYTFGFACLLMLTVDPLSLVLKEMRMHEETCLYIHSVFVYRMFTYVYIHMI